MVNLHAQSEIPDLSWAKLAKFGAYNQFSQLKPIGADAQAVYWYASADWALNLWTKSPDCLYKYDIENQNLLAVKYNCKTPLGKAETEFAIEFGEDFLFFSSIQDKKLKTHTLYMQTMNKSTMSLSTKMTKVIELNYEGESNYRPALFRYSISPDKSKLLIGYQLLKNGEIIRSGFKVFDTSMNELWGDKGIVSGKKERAILHNFVVDNNGVVWFCGTTEQKGNKKSGLLLPEAFVTMVTETNKEYEAIDIPFPSGNYATDLCVGVSPNNEIYCAGVFSRDKMKNALGMFSAKITADEAPEVTLQEFGIDLITRDWDNGDTKKAQRDIDKGKDYEQYDTYVDNIQFLSNGTLLISAKKAYTTVVYVKTTAYYHYHFGDIFFANVRQNGSFNWINKVSRDVISVNAALFGQYQILIDHKDNIHLFYNKIASMTMLLQMNLMGQTQTLHDVFTPEGKNTETILNLTKNNKIVARPWEVFLFDQNKVVMSGHKGKKDLTFTTFSIEP
jgi:hypothetical protein